MKMKIMNDNRGISMWRNGNRHRACAHARRSRSVSVAAQTGLLRQRGCCVIASRRIDVRNARYACAASAKIKRRNENESNENISVMA
jgi:hypothetical protein